MNFYEIWLWTSCRGRFSYDAKGCPQNFKPSVLENLTSDFAGPSYIDPEFDVEFSNEHEIFIKNLMIAAKNVLEISKSSDPYGIHHQYSAGNNKSEDPTYGLMGIFSPPEPPVHPPCTAATPSMVAAGGAPPPPDPPAQSVGKSR